MKLPTLYARASGGKIKVWMIGTEGADIVTHHGYFDGEMTESRKTAKPKNVGRANETTAEEQAKLEAAAKWKKQREQKGYVEDRAQIDAIPLRPMLAHVYEKRKSALVLPAFVQPKLDGIRCLAQRTDSGVSMVSRNGKPINTLPHIEEFLGDILSPGDVLDGELFTRDLTLQQIGSGVKKASALSERVEYWVYDAVRDEVFKHRFEFIEGLFLAGPCVQVRTEWAHTERVIMQHHEAHIAEGYEGTIVRNAEAPYRRGHRSADLLKLKDFEDAEFEIIGGKEGEGKDSGTVIFRCKCEAGEFDVRPRGTHEQRTRWFRDLEALIGRQLTVRYQRLTDEGKPFHPVGVALRDYE